MASGVGVITDLTLDDIRKYYDYMRWVLENRGVDELDLYQFLFKPIYSHKRILIDEVKVSPPSNYVCLNIDAKFCYLAFKNDGSEFLFFDFVNQRYVRVLLCRDNPVCVDHAVFVYRILWAWLNLEGNAYDPHIKKYKIDADAFDKFMNILVNHYTALKLPLYPLALITYKYYYWGRLDNKDFHLINKRYSLSYVVADTISQSNIGFVEHVLNFVSKYNIFDRFREIIYDIAPEVSKYVSMIGIDPNNISVQDLEFLIRSAVYEYRETPIIGGISFAKKKVPNNKYLYKFKAKITSYSFIVDSKEFQTVDEVLDYITSRKMAGMVMLRFRTDANIEYDTVPIINFPSSKYIKVIEKMLRFTDEHARSLIGKNIVNIIYSDGNIVFINADKTFHLKGIPSYFLLMKYFVSRGSR